MAGSYSFQNLMGKQLSLGELNDVERLMDLFVLFFIHPATRRVNVCGITTNPDSEWMKQKARNVTAQPRRFHGSIGINSSL